MPIFDYQCLDCNTVYDVFHKTREIPEDVVCPSCESTRYKKMMSAPMVAIGTKSEPTPSASGGGCCGGACGLN